MLGWEPLELKLLLSIKYKKKILCHLQMYRILSTTQLISMSELACHNCQLFAIEFILFFYILTFLATLKDLPENQRDNPIP